MSMVRTVIRREPLADKIVKAIIYVFTGAIFAVCLRGYVSDFLETYYAIFQNDLVITAISIALGYLLATIILYMLKHKSELSEFIY